VHKIARLIAIGLSVALVASGCADSFSPFPRGRQVFVTSSETDELVVVDGSTGQLMHRVPLQEAVMLGSLSSDSSQLYLAEGLASAGPFVALSTNTFHTDWSEDQSTPTMPRTDRWHEVAVDAYTAIGSSSDGTRLYVHPAFRSDTMGIALLDAHSRDLIGFGGEPLSLEAQGLVLAPPGTGRASGALLAVGRRDAQANPAVDWIFWLDPSTLAISDSSPVVDVPGGGQRRLLSPALAPDFRSLFVIGLTSSVGLYKYDLQSRQEVAHVPLQSDGFITLSPDGSTVYFMRRSDDPATPATLSMYDANLNLLTTIALPDIDQQPARVQDVTTSLDGTRVYVIAGTGSRIPLGGITQPGHLFAIDPAARTIVWDTPLNIWAPAQVFVR
jgi:hypothetical protein